MHRRRRRNRVGRLLLLLLVAVAFVGGVATGLHLRALPLRPVRAAVAAVHVAPPPLPKAWLLDVPALDQYPALPNGCEVTSLAMLLEAVGHPLSPETLARLVPRDPTPRVLAPDGTIRSWGDPEVGFVGSMRDAPDGFGVYHKPIVRLLNRILPGRAVDLTGKPFVDVERYVAAGRPVVVWTTITLKPTNRWITWESPEGPIHATLLEHAVLVVGYDSTQILIDNPDGGKKAQAVPRGPFLAAWRQLGEQAVTVALPPAS